MSIYIYICFHKYLAILRKKRNLKLNWTERDKQKKTIGSGYKRVK